MNKPEQKIKMEEYWDQYSESVPDLNHAEFVVGRTIMHQEDFYKSCAKITEEAKRNFAIETLQNLKSAYIIKRDKAQARVQMHVSAKRSHMARMAIDERVTWDQAISNIDEKIQQLQETHYEK